MKTKHLVSLLQDNFVTVSVVFNSDRNQAAPVAPPLAHVSPKHQTKQTPPPAWAQELQAEDQWGERPRHGAQQAYIYKAVKTDQYKAGDFVVIEDPQRVLKIAEIVEVHEHAQIDYDSDYDYKWIVQRVDLTSYANVLKAEQTFKAGMVEVQRITERNKLIAEYKANYLPTDPEAQRVFENATKAISGLNLYDGTEAKDGN